MIKPTDIPDEVVEALAVAWRDEMNSAYALAAAINAWPEMSCRPTFGPSRIILHLPQKETSE